MTLLATVQQRKNVRIPRRSN